MTAEQRGDGHAAACHAYNKYFFAYEKLQNIKGDILMQRTPDTIQVTGYDKVPTPKKDESLLVQYSEDAFVKPIISEMLKLYPKATYGGPIY